ncbi:MAG: trypsin-like peptidase domain-containing protein [Bacteroidota bacterium]
MKIYIKLLLVLSLSTSACASLFNKSYQDLSVKSLKEGAADVKVFVDGDEVKAGQEVSVARDFRAHQLRVERAGYKTRYEVFTQTKRSSMRFSPLIFTGVATAAGVVAGEGDFRNQAYNVSSISLALVLASTLLDGGSKAYDYENQVEVAAPHVLLVERNKNQKYLYAQTVSLELREDSLSLISSTFDEYRKGQVRVGGRRSNSEVIAVDNTIFAGAVSTFLDNASFSDTSQSVLKAQYNTRYLNAKISNLKLVGLGRTRRSALAVASEVSVEWELLDVYGNVKFSETNEARSGEFSITRFGIESAVDKSISDAIEYSLLKLLKKEAFKELLQLEAATIADYPLLGLNKPITLTSDIESALKASVTIKVGDGHGSGFFVSQDGFVITNFHVIAGKEQVTVVDNQGNNYTAAIIRQDEIHDLALLKVDAAVPYAFHLPSEKDYEPGDIIFAIGTPTSDDFNQTLTKGIISSLRKIEESEMLQTDASINPGNSGGPLTTGMGQLIGVVNSKLMGLGVEGIAFAIPAYKIREYLSLYYLEE